MKVLLTGAFNWEKEQINRLKDMGCEIVYTEREDQPLKYEALEAEAVICNWLFVNHDIRQFTKLKYIQLLSAGLDRVPLDYISDNGIVINNARGVYSIPIAEYTICGVLQLYKSSLRMAENQKRHVWKKIRTLHELSGKHVCIIGTGSVGCEIAKKFSVFTDDICGVDLVPVPKTYMKTVVGLDKLDEVISESDIVILTLPLTNKTKGMFDKNRFEKMKNGSVLVNVARGGLVIERDLENALDTKLMGAVIDVFETEPLPYENSLWDKNNVIVSPHNSFVSENNDLRMWNVVCQNLYDYISCTREE